MSLEIEATYEHGILKPLQTLPLQEGQRVNLTIRLIGSTGKFSDSLKWKGSQEDLEYLAESDENQLWAREE